MSDLIIRNVEPADYEELFALIKRILTEIDAQKSADFDEKLWQWQCATPGFESLVVVAEDNKKLVGAYHLISRDMMVGKKQRKMVHLQDLVVEADYRRQGLFLKLSNSATDQLPELQWDITYALPTQYRSYAGFTKRLSYTHIATLPVYVRPLLPGKILAEKLPGGKLWHLPGKLAEKLYDVALPLPQPDSDMEIVPLQRFDSTVNTISRLFISQCGIGIGCTRTVDYLNWRYLDNPAISYQAWGLKQADMLSAYLITRKAHLFGMDVLLLMDMATTDNHLLEILIAERLRTAREENLALAVVAGLHPFFRGLWKKGFIPIPEKVNPRAIKMVIRQHTRRVGVEVFDPANWYLTLGDWDVF